MEVSRQAFICLRIVACAGLVLLGCACFSEWHFREFLAPEASTYQSEWPDSIRSGFNPLYAMGHLLLLAGFLSAIAGVLLVCRKNRIGLLPLACCAPAIAGGASLFESGAAYPSLQPIYVTILWCCTSAAWASTLSLSLLLLGRPARRPSSEHR